MAICDMLVNFEVHEWGNLLFCNYFLSDGEGGGGNLPIFRWVRASDDPKLWPITGAIFHKENL